MARLIYSVIMSLDGYIAVVGGGTRALPDRVRLDLALADERRSATAPSTSAITRPR